MQTTALAALVSAAVAGLLGGWGGYRIGSAGCADAAVEHAEQLQAQALAYADGWRIAVEDARRDAAAEAGRLARAQALREAAANAAKEVIHDAAADPDPRECGWRPEHRLRIETLYRAYGHAPSGARSALGVQAALWPAAEYGSGAGSLGAGNDGLGAGLRPAAR